MALPGRSGSWVASQHGIANGWGNERLMERPGGADLSAIAGVAGPGEFTAGSTPSHRLWSGGV